MKKDMDGFNDLTVSCIMVESIQESLVEGGKSHQLSCTEIPSFSPKKSKQK